jgi:hypothetical protein
MYSADYPGTDSSYNANGYLAAALLVREWPREPFSTPVVFPLSLVKSGTLPFLLGGNFVATSLSFGLGPSVLSPGLSIGLMRLEKIPIA